MKILIVDCGYLCHRSKHAYQGLSHKGNPTNVLYGFFMGLADMARERKPDRVCFCWDGGNDVRRRHSPIYKANRNTEPTQEDMDAREQMSVLQHDLLPAMGFKNIFCQRGLEADDLVAQVVRQTPEHERIVFSADRDLWQVLLDDHVFIVAQRGNQFTLAMFKEQTGLDEAWKWAAVKCVAGCPGDNVIGIPGVGEGTALKWVRGERVTGKRGDLLDKYAADCLLRNGHLVKLPHHETQAVVIEPDAVNPKAAKAVLMDYGMESLIKRDDWINYLCRSAVRDGIRRGLNRKGMEI